MIRFDDLPSDPLLLKQKLIETTSIIEKVSAEKVALADECNVAIAQRDAALQENEKLLLILSQYKRALFGRRSEKMDADQLQLLLSGNEASIVAGAANENAAAAHLRRRCGHVPIAIAACCRFICLAWMS
jgi:hypothetical protein